MQWWLIVPASLGAIALGLWVWYRVSGLRPARSRTAVLAVHDLIVRPSLSAGNISAHRFSSFLRHAERLQFRFVSISEAVAEPVPSASRPCLCVTFDDGYRSLYRFFYEEIQPREIPMAVFVVTGFIGRAATWDYRLRPAAHLDWEELRKLAQSPLVTIAAHSHTHPMLTRVEPSRLSEEVELPRRVLADKLGLSVEFFSYPFGRFNRRVIAAVKGAGYRAAFSGTPWRVPGVDRAYARPRIPLNVFDNLFTFEQKLKSGRCAWVECAKARVIELYSGLTFDARERGSDPIPDTSNHLRNRNLPGLLPLPPDQD